ncbi:MAG TPA: MmcQ/YjbR family DNA-binding protein [Caulobacteraceae bacterium]|nr:MmcQ/YjbR family DNA-binding protein [Caulobacteraceae bacterium]
MPAVTTVVQWGADNVYKVGGRIFAVASSSGVSFKVSDIAFEALTESGRARPAPYLARAKWVRFDDLDEMDAAETTDWLAQAHALVAAKLTRAQRRELGLG